MPSGWTRCRTCGWWQKSSGPCVGCTHVPRSAPPSKKGPRNAGLAGEPLTHDLLHKRWVEARNSAANTHHVKIERLCTHCLTRTVNAKPDCRSCGRSREREIHTDSTGFFQKHTSCSLTIPNAMKPQQMGQTSTEGKDADLLVGDLQM